MPNIIIIIIVAALQLFCRKYTDLYTVTNHTHTDLLPSNIQQV